MLKAIKNARVLVDCQTGEMHVDLGDGICKPMGGGGAQPDLNAAEGEPGHVLNRTHYKEVTGTTEILPETTFYFDDDGMCTGDLSAFAAVPSAGSVCKVTWDGVTYNCEAISMDDTIMFGNFSLMGKPDTGEPFAMGISEQGNMFMVMAEGEYHTCSITSDVVEVKKLSPVFYDQEWLKFFVEGAVDPVLGQMRSEISTDTINNIKFFAGYYTVDLTDVWPAEVNINTTYELTLTDETVPGRFDITRERLLILYPCKLTGHVRSVCVCPDKGIQIDSMDVPIAIEWQTAEVDDGWYRYRLWGDYTKLKLRIDSVN